MRPQIRALLELVSQAFACPEPIVEIGARLVPGQEAMADLRPLFRGRHYIGCDMEYGPGVDRLEDLHALTFEDGEVGTFILSDTLEHVTDPFRAMRELSRCLSKEAGLIFMTSVMNFPIHAHPNDYWRFTPEAFRELGNDLGFFATLYAGDPRYPHSVCLIGGFRDGLADRVQAFVDSARQLQVHAPPQRDGASSEVIRKLARLVVAGQDTSIEAASGLSAALEKPFAATGWVLEPGTWVQGWHAGQEVECLETQDISTAFHVFKKAQENGTAIDFEF